jgi:hypothetical protein
MPNKWAACLLAELIDKRCPVGFGIFILFVESLDSSPVPPNLRISTLIEALPLATKTDFDFGRRSAHALLFGAVP